MSKSFKSSFENTNGTRVPIEYQKPRAKESHILPPNALDFRTYANYLDANHLPRTELPSISIKMRSGVRGRKSNAKLLELTESSDDEFHSKIDLWVETNGIFNDDDGGDLIHHCIVHCNFSRFEKVLSCTSANSIDNLYSYAFSCIDFKSTEILEYLLKSGVDSNNSALILRVLNSSNLKIITLAQSYGMDLSPHSNLGLCFSIGRPVTGYGSRLTPIEDLIDLFMNLGADINCQNSLPMTLSIMNFDVVPKLIGLGGDINCRNGYILRHMVDNVDLYNIEKLLDFGVDATVLNGKNLITCINSFPSNIIQKMIDRGADFNQIEIERGSDTDAIKKKIAILTGHGLEMEKIALIFSLNHDENEELTEPE